MAEGRGVRCVATSSATGISGFSYENARGELSGNRSHWGEMATASNWGVDLLLFFLIFSGEVTIERLHLGTTVGAEALNGLCTSVSGCRIQPSRAFDQAVPSNIPIPHS